MAMEGDKKKLIDLRVVDLKAELEKRDLDKVGVKAVLIERLEKALRDEGHNPEEYLFECEKKTPKRPSKRGEQDAEGNADESLDTTVEDSKEKEEEEEEEEETAAAVSSTVDAKAEPVAPTAAADADEKKDEAKQGKRKEETADKTVPEANGVDNEDSINLTIGEDEEKLLAEEEETSQDKEQKGKAGIIAPEKIKQEPVEAEEKPAAENDAEKPTEDVASQNSANPTTEATSPKEEKDKKPKATPPATSSSRNLWVSGLSSSTRATDLKQVFSKYGKVIGAKVVTNARTPGARCYGYVTMATSDDASKCIQHLHRTELHARMISVERAKGDSSGPPRKSVAKPPGTPTKKTEEKKRHERKLSTSKSEEKKEEKDISVKAEGDVKTEAEGGETLKVSEEQPQEENSNKEAKKDGTPKNAESVRSEKLRSREVSRERKERDRDRHRSPCSSHHSSRVHSRSPHRRSAGSKQPGVLTFTQIREERERQRLRERERQLREEDRRRREERLRQREIEREQRAEAQRLEREKEKLRLEREKIEAELVRMERERQRLEREKLEREREELKRQQIRFEEARRSSKRPSEDHRDSYGDERKKVATDRRFEGPQSRYEEGSRFERTQNYRVREERRPENDHRVKVDVRHTVRDRYSDASKSDGRYGDRSGDSWHTGNSAPQMKQFGSMSAGSGGMHGRDGWSSNDRKSDVGQGWGASDRWVSAGPMSVVSRGGPNMGGPNSMYGNQQSVSPPGTSNVAMGGGPYSGEMFDSYKPPMGPIRKY